MSQTLEIFFALGLAVLLACSGLASGSETALFSLSRQQVRACAQSTDPRRRQIATLLQRPRDLMVTLLMLNVITNILIQDVIASLTDARPSWWVQVGVPLLLTVLLGELLPKSVALANHLRVAQLVAAPISTLARALAWIRRPLVHAASWLSQLLFSWMRSSEPIQEEELAHALGLGNRTGVLTVEERELCKGALELNSIPLRQFMTPAPEIQTYDLQQPIETLLELIRRHGRSRVPVVQGTLDAVIGVLSASSLFLTQQDALSKEQLVARLEPPHFIPEVSQARDALEMMLLKKLSLLFVVDEYGSINGLVTRDDLVKCIFGQADASDEAEIQRVGFNACIASGRAEVAVFEELFHLQLPNEHHRVTLGGWLTDRMQAIPSPGAEWTENGLSVQVLAAEPTHIVKLYIRILVR